MLFSFASSRLRSEFEFDSTRRREDVKKKRGECLLKIQVFQVDLIFE